MAKAAELTVSWGGGGRNQVGRLIVADGHFSSHQVDLGAAAGVGAHLRVLIEVQLTWVHDFPVKWEVKGFKDIRMFVQWGNCAI